MSKLLETHALQAFYGDFQALFGIDLSVEDGETVAIIGANGSGKSTFLRAVTGMRPATGQSISFDGTQIAGLRANRIHHLGLAMVPEGRRLFPSLTVEETSRSVLPATGRVPGPSRRSTSSFRRFSNGGTMAGPNCPVDNNRWWPSGGR